MSGLVFGVVEKPIITIKTKKHLPKKKSQEKSTEEAKEAPKEETPKAEAKEAPKEEASNEGKIESKK